MNTLTPDYLLLNQPAPSFSLQNEHNRTVTLDNLTGENGVLLAFVLGTYCPTCLETYMKLTRDYDLFAARGVEIAAVALDKWILSHSFKLSMKPPVPFPMLSDEDGNVHRLYDTYDYKGGYVYIDRDGNIRGALRSNLYPGTNAIVNLVDESLDRMPTHSQ